MLKKLYSLVAVLLLASMVLSACSPAATPTQAPAAEQPTTAPAAAEPTTAPAAAEPTKAPEAAPTTAPAAEPTKAPEAAATTAPAAAGAMDYSKVGKELADAFAGKFKGTKVTMAGPFTDNDAVKFNDSVKEFKDKTGIDIQYEGSKEFEASITIRVEGGNAPDIVDFPQPGLLGNMVKKGKAVDLSKVINADWLKQNYAKSWLDMAQMTGPDGPITAGIWGRVNGKSLVWYPKAEFDKAGYKVPQTWDELMALTDQISKDGDTPWCIGIESGAATGWAMTDWIEDVMLRTTSLDNYDKWVRGELKFDSPEVRKAIDVITKIWFNDKYVYGGRKAIATTSFGDAPKPMFENPPKCWLHRQGNFITSFFPEGKKAGTDYAFFYLPPIDPQYGKPVLVAGDIYAMFNDRPEVRAVIQYFSTGASVEGWVKAGGAISPHNDSSLDWYTNEVDRGVADMILKASSLRFDGSDQMPGAVGSGQFWKSMTSFVSGAIDEDTALKEIDAAWPKSEGTTPAATEAPAGTPAPAAAVDGKGKLFCQVTDTGGIDDKSFNATAWKGMEDAKAKYGVDVKYLESNQQTDYEKNINAFMDQKCEAIITVGFLLGDATKAAAEKNPNQKFAIIDFAYDPTIPNVLGLTFATDQAGFLAGYVAAGTTKTGKVGTFGGMQIPGVTPFMDGFALGVAHYNKVHNTKVQVLGWDVAKQTGLFTGDFNNQDKGKTTANNLLQEGADIIMPVAGPVGLGAAAAVKENGKAYIIGVDTDWTVSAAEYADITLTSVMKKMDNAVNDTIGQVLQNQFKGGVYVGTLANGGVDIAPFHNLASMVSSDLQKELDQVKADIIAGKIQTAYKK